MSFLKTILSSCIIILSVTGTAQDTINSNEESYRKQLKLLAKEQIVQLHDGVLLVRLKTKKRTIESLRKMGKDKMADKIESEQRAYNKEIINSFRSSFDFCKTYFFYSHFSQYVKNRQFDKVEFLNDSLLPDPSIRLNTEIFLTAEFGSVSKDTTKHFDGNVTVPGEDGPETHQQYVSGSSARFGALVIMSDQFVQLRKPFPYYVRTYDSLPLERSTINVIGMMNDKLKGFLQKIN